MGPEDFKAWREAMGYTQAQAAEALGLSKPTIENYERGSRREDNRPVAIPKHVALACAAIYHKIGPWKADGMGMLHETHQRPAITKDAKMIEKEFIYNGIIYKIRVKIENNLVEARGFYVNGNYASHPYQMTKDNAIDLKSVADLDAIQSLMNLVEDEIKRGPLPSISPYSA